MVKLHDIGVNFGGDFLFRGLSWHIADQDRVGLVGRNGTGKTTLLRVIAGITRPDEGEATSSKGTTFGYLPQEEVTLRGKSLWSEAMASLEPVLKLRNEQQHIERILESCASRNSRTERLLKRYSELQERFEDSEGYSLEVKVKKVLQGLGFKPEEWHRPTDTFSGGWQMRIALAKLLLASPDVLLLDEPTNHLDIESMRWLEEYLDDFPGVLVIVSHDRYFMDRVVSRISELENGSLSTYVANFSAYLVEKEKRREALLAAHKNQQKKIAQMRVFIERFRANQSKAQLVKSREKMLEKMEKITLPSRPKPVRFSFPKSPRCGRRVLELRGVQKSYGENVVFENVDLLIERGDRIAVLGVNGAGKSTLLRIMAGVEPASRGNLYTDHKVLLHYFAQITADQLSPDHTVLGELEDVAHPEMRSQLRNLLGRFLFFGDAVFKQVKVLSGGEKARLAIAKSLLSPSNLLLLDEPTNHLDLQGREVLGSALKAYDGTIVLVTHDRHLIDQIANKVVEIEDGRVRTYLGNYSDYSYRKAREIAEASPVEEPRRMGKKDRRRLRARERAEESGRLKEMARLESLIEERESRLSELNTLLSDPKLYSDGMRVRSLVIEHRAARAELEGLYHDWELLAG